MSFAKIYIPNLKWFLFQIHTLAQVCGVFQFEILMDPCWLSESITWLSSTSWPITDLSYRFLNPMAQSGVVNNKS
jgi:hypothetical protein